MQRLLRKNVLYSINNPGADPGFFLGGGALVSCCTSTPINHIVIFGGGGQHTSCIMKPQVIPGGGVHTLCTLPLDPPLQPMYVLEHGRFRGSNNGKFGGFLLQENWKTNCIRKKSDVTAPKHCKHTNAVMMLKPLLHIFLFDALFVDKTFCVSGLKLRNCN